MPPISCSRKCAPSPKFSSSLTNAVALAPAWRGASREFHKVLLPVARPMTLASRTLPTACAIEGMPARSGKTRRCAYREDPTEDGVPPYECSVDVRKGNYSKGDAAQPCRLSLAFRSICSLRHFLMPGSRRYRRARHQVARHPNMVQRRHRRRHAVRPDHGKSLSAIRPGRGRRSAGPEL